MAQERKLLLGLFVQLFILRHRLPEGNDGWTFCPESGVSFICLFFIFVSAETLEAPRSSRDDLWSAFLSAYEQLTYHIVMPYVSGVIREMSVMTFSPCMWREFNCIWCSSSVSFFTTVHHRSRSGAEVEML